MTKPSDNTGESTNAKNSNNNHKTRSRGVDDEGTTTVPAVS